MQGPGRPSIVGTGQTIGVVGETNLESADIQSFRDHVRHHRARP